METLEEEVQARERAVTSDATLPRKPTTKVPSTAAALLTGGSSNVPTCCYCQQLHLSHLCKNVSLVEERKGILRAAGRCFACLRRGHIVRQCSSTARCPRCRGRHHISICDQKQPSSASVKSKPSGGGAACFYNDAADYNEPSSPAISASHIHCTLDQWESSCVTADSTGIGI